MEPFKRLESQHEYIPALFSLSTNEVDVNGVTKFVASLYRCDTSDIDEARYTSFIRMTMGTSDKIVDQIKRCNCALLPPCTKILKRQLKDPTM